MKITSEDIENAEDELACMRRNYLRENGWEYTCEVPGGFWMWKKTLRDGSPVVCSEDFAVSIQRNLEA